MDTKKEVRIKTRMRGLAMGEALELDRARCVPSSVGVMAYALAADTGRKFSVTKTETSVTVTRVG